MLFCSYLKVVFTNFGLTNSSRSSLFTRIPNKFFLGISLTVPHIFAFQSVIKAIQLSAPLSNQLQLPCAIYTKLENAQVGCIQLDRSPHGSIFVEYLVELLWNILGSSLFFSAGFGQ